MFEKGNPFVGYSEAIWLVSWGATLMFANSAKAGSR